MKQIFVPFGRLQPVIIFLFLIATAASKGQVRLQPVPSQFDVFIKKPEIEWAASVNDTFRFQGFNNMLMKRFEKREIQASLPVYHGLTDFAVIKFISKDSVDRVKLYAEKPPVKMDRIDNPLSDLNKYRAIKTPVDSSENSLTAVYEIFYVDKGRLKSYQPFASLRIIQLFTKSGIVLGVADYFSTCYSKDYAAEYNGKNGKGNYRFLSQTTRRIVTEPDETGDNLKTTYGRNLIETLWPYVMKDKFTIYAFETKKNIPAADIRHLRTYLQMPVPRYDSVGKMEASPFADREVNPSVFKYADVVQDWYYDIAKNRLVTKVRELILLGFSGDGDDRRIFPVLKLIF